MATTTAASLPTQTFVALTTPYVQPSSCTNIRDLGIFHTNEYNSALGTLSYTYRQISAVGSPIFHPKFSGCQPPGWKAPASMLIGRILPPLYFSPAVCPSDWATHSIYVSAKSYLEESATGFCTGAYCCKRYVHYPLPPLKLVPSFLIFFYSSKC